MTKKRPDALTAPQKVVPLPVEYVADAGHPEGEAVEAEEGQGTIRAGLIKVEDEAFPGQQRHGR
eukprot:4460799-Lingulodinium_polyedra.AAC.1